MAIAEPPLTSVNHARHGPPDWSTATPQIADGVRVWPIPRCDEICFRVEVDRGRRYVQLGESEYAFLSLLDGQTTVPQACGLAAAELGSRAVTMDQARTITAWAIGQGMLTDRGEPAGPSPSARPRGLNPFWIEIPIPRLERLINAVASKATWIASPPLLWFAMAMIGSALLTHLFSSSRTLDVTTILAPNNWAYLVMTWAGLKLIHELSHAIACARAGASVGRCGVAFLMLAPLAFVDVSSCWRLPSRRSRIAVAAAGMIMEGTIAAAAYGWLRIGADPWIANHLSNVVFTAGVGTVLFNANVLMRFDGYFMLSDWLDRPNLADEAIGRVTHGLRWCFWGEPGRRDDESPVARAMLFGYGVAMLVWRWFVCLGMVAVATTMFAGAGWMLAAIGVLIWIAKPGWRTWRRLDSLRRDEPSRYWRALIATSLVTVAVLAGTFVLPIPASVHFPAIVRHHPDAIVRAPADGWIERWHVAMGDSVQVEQPLVTLRNRQLTRQAENAAREREILSRRLTAAIERRDPIERRKAQANLIRILRQAAQHRIRADQLRVLARRRGTAIVDDPDSKIGTFVREGDPLLSVAFPGDIEIIAYIDAAEIESVRRIVGKPVRLRGADAQVHRAVLAAIEPRATRTLVDDALSAANGGDMLVQVEAEPDGSSRSRLERPHFIARLHVDSDAPPHPGATLTAHFGYRSETPYERLRRWLRGRAGYDN